MLYACNVYQIGQQPALAEGEHSWLASLLLIIITIIIIIVLQIIVILMLTSMIFIIIIIRRILIIVCIIVINMMIIMIIAFLLLPGSNESNPQPWRIASKNMINYNDEIASNRLHDMINHR